MAHIVRVHAAGGPEMLRLDEVELPPPGPGEVAIRVAAIGLNRAETFFRMGNFGLPILPAAIGGEAAGTVEAVGPGVEGVAPGDRVSVVGGLRGLPFGTYGDHILASVGTLYPRPATLSAAEAAALWVGHLTAYAPMVEIARIGPGTVVLLNAATSSVGVAAINFVRLQGGTPVAITRSAGKAAALRAAGAAHVITTDSEDYLTRVKDITGGELAPYAFDPVMGPGLEALLAGVQHGGTLIHYGDIAGPAVIPHSAMMRNQSITGYAAVDLLPGSARRERATRFITEGVAAGALRMPVSRTFALEEAAAAHAALESNQHVGKIVMLIDEDA